MLLIEEQIEKMPNLVIQSTIKWYKKILKHYPSMNKLATGIIQDVIISCKKECDKRKIPYEKE